MSSVGGSVSCSRGGRCGVPDFLNGEEALCLGSGEKVRFMELGLIDSRKREFLNYSHWLDTSSMDEILEVGTSWNRGKYRGSFWVRIE